MELMQVLIDISIIYTLSKYSDKVLTKSLKERAVIGRILLTIYELNLNL